MEDTDTQSTDEASLDHISESDDLMFEFERNLRELLLGLHSGKDVASFSNNGKLNEVRDQKSPLRGSLSKLNHRSQPKRKLVAMDNLEGIPSRPLLIYDWSDLQISSYCDLVVLLLLML